MNLLEELQSRWPSASLEELDAVLWMTPYPFVSADQIATCLDEMKSKFGEKIQDVIDGTMAEIDAARAPTRARPGRPST